MSFPYKLVPAEQARQLGLNVPPEVKEVYITGEDVMAESISVDRDIYDRPAGQTTRTIRECELERLVLSFIRATMTSSGRQLAELHEEARRLGIKP